MTLARLKSVLAVPRLRGFEDVEDFQRYCKGRFALLPGEYRSLYEVLVKLQSLGHDALRTLSAWQRDMTTAECAEFMRFLIRVEHMEIDDLLNAA